MKKLSLFSFLIISSFTTSLWAAKVTIAYNPAITQKKLSPAELNFLNQSLSTPDFQANVIPFEIPSSRTTYVAEQIQDKKDFASVFAKASADIGIMDAHEYLLLKTKMPDTKVIATYSANNDNNKGLCTQDIQLVVLAGSRYLKMGDLIGKKVGIASPDEANFFPAKYFLSEQINSGLKFVVLNSTQELREKLLKKEIEAAVDSYSVSTDKHIINGFFRRAVFPNDPSHATPTHRSIYKSRYEFPCGIIYARNSVNSQQISTFLSKLGNNAVLQIGHLNKSFDPGKIEKIESTLNESTSSIMRRMKQ